MSNVSYLEEEVQDVVLHEDSNDVWSEYPTSIRLSATFAILITAIIGLSGKSKIHAPQIYVLL